MPGKWWEPAGILEHTQTQWNTTASKIRGKQLQAIYSAHTLLLGCTVFLSAGSCCSCLIFLDGVFLSLGGCNLSISFIVKEVRWDRCESVNRRKLSGHSRKPVSPRNKDAPSHIYWCVEFWLWESAGSGFFLSVTKMQLSSAWWQQILKFHSVKTLTVAKQLTTGKRHILEFQSCSAFICTIDPQTSHMSTLLPAHSSLFSSHIWRNAKSLRLSTMIWVHDGKEEKKRRRGDEEKQKKTINKRKK